MNHISSTNICLGADYFNSLVYVKAYADIFAHRYKFKEYWFHDISNIIV